MENVEDNLAYQLEANQVPEASQAAPTPSTTDTNMEIITKTTAETNENEVKSENPPSQTMDKITESENEMSHLNVPTTPLEGLQDIPWATARFLVTHNTFSCRVLHFPPEILINFGAYMVFLSVIVVIGNAFGLFGAFFIAGLILNVSIAIVFTLQAYCSGSLAITCIFFLYHSSCVIASYYWIEICGPLLEVYWLICIPVVAGLSAGAFNSFVAHKVLTGAFPISQEPAWMPVYYDIIFGMFSVPFFDFMSFVYEYGWFGVSEFDQRKCHILSEYYKAIPCFSCQKAATTASEAV